MVCGQDGAHFADAGPSVFMDCPGGQDHPTNKSDCAGWLGSGSVWKKLPAKRDEGEGLLSTERSAQADEFCKRLHELAHRRVGLDRYAR